jgi:hypothetical protein
VRGRYKSEDKPFPRAAHFSLFLFSLLLYQRFTTYDGMNSYFNTLSLTGGGA